MTSTGISVPLQIRPLQPAVDATSGTFGDGGWARVRAWCKNYPPKDRAADLFQPLFERDQPLDVLLVQMDGDAIKEYTTLLPHIQVPTNPDVSARLQIVEAVLEDSLWGGSIRRFQDPYARRALSGRNSSSLLVTWIEIAGMAASNSRIPAGAESGRTADAESHPPGSHPERAAVIRGWSRNRDIWRKLATNPTTPPGTSCPSAVTARNSCDACRRRPRSCTMISTERPSPRAISVIPKRICALCLSWSERGARRICTLPRAVRAQATRRPWWRQVAGCPDERRDPLRPWRNRPASRSR